MDDLSLKKSSNQLIMVSDPVLMLSDNITYELQIDLLMRVSLFDKI